MPHLPKKEACQGLFSDSSASEKETEGHSEGRIYRAQGSSKEYYVYHKGKKINFGDPSMKNRNNDDGARANFMARHNCAEKKDKSKAGYWACRVWRKGYKGPSSGGKRRVRLWVHQRQGLTQEMTMRVGTGRRPRAFELVS